MATFTRTLIMNLKMNSRMKTLYKHILFALSAPRPSLPKNIPRQQIAAGVNFVSK